jgi:site-specific DNA-methyltransferase (adenine-specific)
VALVVTSPPYFAGKQYEEELERDGIPSSYLEYLEMLTDVFAECARKLEPGGRIAVNVANLGRKPYRSLSADVIRILEHDLGLLLRGELVWQKGEGASGSCAWGSWRSPSNPVLRDLTERVIVASKGRFDRARTAKQRAAQGLPHVTTLLPEDFLTLTLDVWSIPPESARRVGHPAPFPVELPEQLIRLYTYADDLVLDPFMGSGSTLVAAARLGRRYVGYDLDPAYVDMARQRVAAEGSPTTGDVPSEIGDLAARKLAERQLTEAGFVITARDVKVPGGGVSIDLDAVDKSGRRWMFEVAGSFTSQRGGLSRTDTVWRQLGRAAAIGGRVPGVPIVILTTRLPRRRSEGDLALRAAGPAVIHDVVDLLDPEALGRLAAYAGRRVKPLAGYWTDDDLSR